MANVFTYFADGSIATATNAAGRVSNTYDALNRLSFTTGAAPRSAVSYSLYPAGQVSNVVSVAGTNSYLLDAAGRLTSITTPTGTFVFAYNSWNGLVAGVTNHNARLGVSYSYDQLDRVTNIVWKSSTGNVVRSFGYNYDNAGNITNIVREAGSYTRGFSYDALDRLIGEITNGVTVSTLYDLAGNRTNRGGARCAYVFTNGMQTDRLASFGTGTTNKFDAAGNVTNTLRSGVTLALIWNRAYQLTEAKTNNVSALRCGFDALGRRAWTWEGGTTNWHVYAGPHVIADVNPTGVLLRAYTYGPGIDNLLAMTVYTSAVPRTYYTIRDHQNTVWALTDTNGVVVESYDFDAWGRVLSVKNGAGTIIKQSALGNRYLYQGREYSFSTGLYYFRARWYDPVTGRWLSNDPIGISGGINQYVAFENNPVNNTDPNGLFVGAPGTGESFIPIWGSGRQAINDFQTGHYVWGTVNTVMAVSDVFLLKSAATIAVKGAWKTGGVAWSTVRGWLGKRGYAEAGQHVHHGVIPRNGWGKNVADRVKNQPWNLKTLDPPSGIDANRWHQMVEGKRPGLSPIGRWWEGTPDWLRYAEMSGAGRIGNAMRGDDSYDRK